MKKLAISCIVLILGLASPLVHAGDNSKTTGVSVNTGESDEAIEELESVSEDESNPQSANDYGRLLRLQSRRGVKVFYENEMRVVVHRGNQLICIDPDFVDRRDSATSILGTPFCGSKPRIRYNRKRFRWVKDRRGGFTTWTLRRRQS